MMYDCVMQNRLDRPVRISGFVLAACLIIFEILLVARYCCVLQSQYYTHNGPFFDSVSYYNMLAQIYSASCSTGLRAGFQDFPGRTVFLPWPEVALIAQFRPLSRSLGIWLQAVWLLPLALSLLWYQIVKRKRDVLSAIAVTIPFFGFRAIFHYAGGLCDFRMDLSLWIFYSLAAIWFLIACDSKSIAPWLLCGIFVGLGCLARSTAAIYFTVAFVPLIFFRAHVKADRRVLLRGLSVGIGAALVICGWFFIANFQKLYQYYFVWNHDANDHLPLPQALQHIRLAFDHVGQSAALCCLTFGILTVALAKPLSLSPSLPLANKIVLAPQLARALSGLRAHHPAHYYGRRSKPLHLHACRIRVDAFSDRTDLAGSAHSSQRSHCRRLDPARRLRRNRLGT